MFRNNFLLNLVVYTIFLSACIGPVSPGQVTANANQLPVNTAQVNTPTATPTANTTESTQSADSSAQSAVDLTHLEIGDGKVSTKPKVGYIFSCQTQFNGGGAFTSGDWINGDGTWDSTKKPIVDGSVNWQSSFSITLDGDQRVITSNDLPNHPTGMFPVLPGDDAYQFDRNPNFILTQTIQLNLPASPQLAAASTCLGMGMIGIMISGVEIFNALDAGGRDAVAHEIQDDCDGHPQQDGQYHYHSLSSCIKDDDTGQSQLVGYALDGFGIYGPRDASGRILTDADLDECHGITSEIDWDGQRVSMYHYVATSEYPYTIGCYRGAPVMTGQQQGGQSNGQPPQAAIDACNGLSQDIPCTVNTPNGSISGTCQTTPNSSQLVCVPAAGPPKP